MKDLSERFHKEALIAKDFHAVKCMLKSGMDIDCTVECNYVLFKDNLTVLQRAIELNDTNTVSLFLSLGASIRVKDYFSDSPLGQAVSRRNIFNVMEILKYAQSKDINYQGHQGKTPLHKAVEVDSIEIANVLINHGAKLDIVDNNGDIPAYKIKSAEMLEVFLKHGLDINARDKNGKTLLHLAAEKGSLKLLQALIKHQANMLDITNDGKTLLHLAVKQADYNTLCFLLSLKQVRTLINHKDAKGNTALHELVETRKPSLEFSEIITKFISCGASLEITNNANYNVISSGIVKGAKDPSFAQIFCAALGKMSILTSEAYFSLSSTPYQHNDNRPLN